MSKDISIEILPNGRIKFKRGSKSHNENMKKIIYSIIGNDDKTICDVDKFFSGSEDVELLIGETIFCG
jgi:hypothetical protein